MAAKRRQRAGDPDPYRGAPTSSTDDRHVRFEDHGSEAELTINGLTTPRTLDELLEITQVDTSVWEVDRHLVNSWTLASGEPAFQVKAWLRRRVPIAVHWPELRRVDVHLAFARKGDASKAASKGSSKGIRKALIVPDCQNGYLRDLRTGDLDPFHDRRCWDVVVQVAAEEQPDRIVLLGDMLDLPEWSSKFWKSPEMYHTTQPALVELAWWLGRLRTAAPKAQVDLIIGNHEARLEKAVGENLIGAWGLLGTEAGATAPIWSVRRLLNLDAIGVGCHGPYPNGEIWLNDNLRCSHGETVRAASGDTTKAILQEARCSEIVGHIHRCETASKTVHAHRGPVTYVAHSPGTLARLDGPIPKAKSRVNWQNGCSLVEYEPGNGFFQIHPIQIYAGQTVWRGRRLKGSPDTKALRRDTGGEWKF